MNQKYLLAVMALLFSFPPVANSAEDQLVSRLTSYHRGSVYESIVRQSDLDRTPRWSLEQPYPPLSASAAKIAATMHVIKLIPESGSWPIQRITLAQVGREEQWIYIVEFTREPIEEIGSLAKPFRVVVLLDGTIIQRKIDPVKQPTPRGKPDA